MQLYRHKSIVLGVRSLTQSHGITKLGQKLSLELARPLSDCPSFEETYGAAN
jgi:hypothetical protein